MARYDFGLVPWPRKRPGYVFVLTDVHGTFATDERGRKLLRISSQRIGEGVNILSNLAHDIYFSRDSRRGDTRYRADHIGPRYVTLTNLSTGRTRTITKAVFDRRYWISL